MTHQKLIFVDLIGDGKTYQMLVNFLNTVIIGTAISLIILSFVFLIGFRKIKTNNYLMFAMTFLYGCILLIDPKNEIYTINSFLRYINHPMEYFLGALIFYNFTIALENRNRIKPQGLLLFIPGIISLLMLIPYFPLSGNGRFGIGGVDDIQSDTIRQAYKIMMSGSQVWILFCILLFILRFRLKMGTVSLNVIRHFRIILIYSSLWILPMISWIYLSFRFNPVLFKVTSITANFLFISCFFIAMRNREYIAVYQEEAVKTKYKRTKIKSLNIKNIISRIDDLMSRDNIYQDENLNLNSFSKILEVTPHQLSELLNNEMGTNFKNYLNNARIRAAKKILAEDSEIGIIQVAYKCGFGSKSSFNTLFLKSENLTPSEFRNKREKTGSRL